MKFIIIFLLIHIKLSYAVDIEKCLTQSEDLKNINDIENECFSLIKTVTSDNQKNFSPNLEAYGYKNFLFIEKAKKKFVIGGAESKLSDIVSIKISQNEKWLAVIQTKEGRKEILVFPTNRNGNIAPYKVYSGELFQSITDIAFHAESAEIYFLDGKSGDVFVVSEESDSRMLIEERKPIKLRSYEKDDLIVKSPSQIELIDSKLFVFDENEQKLAIVSIDKKAKSHIKNILAPGLKNNISKIRLRDAVTLDVFTQDESEKAQISLETVTSKTE